LNNIIITNIIIEEKYKLIRYLLTCRLNSTVAISKPRKTQAQQEYNTCTQYGNTKQTTQHKCNSSRKRTKYMKYWNNKYFDDKFI